MYATYSYMNSTLTLYFHREPFQKYVTMRNCCSVLCYFLNWSIAMDTLALDDCLRSFQPYQRLFE